MIVALVTTFQVSTTMAMMIVENYGIYPGLSRDYPPGRSDHEERVGGPCWSPYGAYGRARRAAHKSDGPMRETDHRSGANEVGPYVCRFGQR
jgi:hypothetical protein